VAICGFSTGNMSKMAQLVVLLLSLASVHGLFLRSSPATKQQQISRRDALVGSALLPALVGSVLAAPSEAADDAEVPIYFGVGCFWHVQHEFVDAERSLLGRGDDQLTALAGYAGGKQTGKDTNRPGNKEGLVCYHNLQGVADYGKLGYGEVVGVRVPSSKVGDFAEVYFKLFDKNGDRPDKGDRGPEYRSLLGLPGGKDSPLYAQVAEALKRSPLAETLSLAAGGGDDGDTLGKRLVWVMDTKEFPFRQGEVYHQFHDGFFPGEDYPREYNSLQQRSVAGGRLKGTGCPDVV